MFRSSLKLILGLTTLAAIPATSQAQYRSAFAQPSPLYVYPNGSGGYGVQTNFGVSAMTPYGQMNLLYAFPYQLSAPYAYAPEYSSGPGYFTGGSGGTGYANLGLQQDLVAAQQAAGKALKRNQDEAREMIDAQWAYEKLGVTGQVAAKGAKEQAEELQKALAVKDESEVASGTALNRILVAVVSLEGKKGAKAVSAFLPPQLLDELRFSGGAPADLLNLAKVPGKLPFPPNFPGAKNDDLKASIEADFAAAVAPLRLGKPADPAKIAKLEATVKKLEGVAPPVIRNLSFDDALTARRFMNQLNASITALKSPSTVGIINPKWATDGTSVSDLVRFMTRYKLMFAPASTGSESAYFFLHKALATYLFVLDQGAKK